MPDQDPHSIIKIDRSWHAYRSGNFATVGVNRLDSHKSLVAANLSSTVPSDTRRTLGNARAYSVHSIVAGRQGQIFVFISVFLPLAASWLSAVLTHPPQVEIRPFPVVTKRNNVSDAKCFMPARRLCSKSNPDNRRHHLASYRIVSAISSILRSASLSVVIVPCNPSRYCLRSRTVHKTAIKSLCVVCYACSALFKDRD